MGRKKSEDMEIEETETAEVADTRSKRDIIAEAIEAGGATMESLMEAANCKYASVMSNFSMLRLMGKCPVKDVEVVAEDEDGNEVTEMTYRLVSTEEWEAIKVEKAENAKTKKAPTRTPEEMLEILTKRVEKAYKADASAQTRLDANADSQILQLRAQKASIELQIANLELEELQATMAE